MQKIIPYFKIARLDHWFKNIFCLPGIILAYFICENSFFYGDIHNIIIGFIAICAVVSSNYTLNEILDAKTDLLHPVKFNRPIPSGLVNISIAYLQYLLLAFLSFYFAYQLNLPFLITIISLWVMGILYNAQPVRSKDIPYVDVLSESVNNPIRFCAGWFMVSTNHPPPITLIIAYWMIGAFFMTLKRYAELKFINDKEKAICYRKSFSNMNENKLLSIAFLYACLFCLFYGLYISLFRIELVLSFPFVSAMISIYFQIALKENSPVQNPEYLYREKKLMLSVFLVALSCLFCLFQDIPLLNNFLFN